jgi:hypothetical protein
VRGLEQMFDEPLLMRRIMRQEMQILPEPETDALS